MGVIGTMGAIDAMGSIGAKVAMGAIVAMGAMGSIGAKVAIGATDTMGAKDAMGSIGAKVAMGVMGAFVMGAPIGMTDDWSGRASTTERVQSKAPKLPWLTATLLGTAIVTVDMPWQWGTLARPAAAADTVAMLSACTETSEAWMPSIRAMPSATKVARFALTPLKFTMALPDALTFRLQWSQ
jgi:hypothetical protein